MVAWCSVMMSVSFRRKVSNAMRFSGRAIGMAEPTSLCSACVWGVGLSGLLGPVVDNITKPIMLPGLGLREGHRTPGPALRVLLTMERKKVVGLSNF
jgi:hypothetical protein